MKEKEIQDNFLFGRNQDLIVRRVGKKSNGDNWESGLNRGHRDKIGNSSR